jgi:hypothetical protein
MRDAFVAKVSSAGTGLVYAGYIGGAAQDEGLGVALDSSGSAYVTGYTTSSESSFPVTGGPDLTFNGVIDAFAAKINIAGSALDYAGYIGGNNSDEGFGIAVDALGNSYVAGRTSSSEATFPTVIGPDVTFNGGEDAFIVKISELVPATPTPTPTSTATATQPPTDTPTPTPTPAPVNVPGKVTGGGSILADGSLAPATLSIESGINASIGDTATFGFAVQFEAGDPNPTGNLTYNDHGADVRIKALSFSLLSIGVGPCGMDTHAKFRGTAEVTGPGMPSMQDFEVDVDECGEPGSAPGVGPDTFMIRTSVGTTIHYLAAGPLVGGNIQVQRD